MDIITKENKDAATLRWLQLAVATEKNRDTYTRPALSGIHIDGNVAETADGFKLFQAPLPAPLSDFPDGSIVRIADAKPLHKTTGRVYEGTIVESQYPNTAIIFPRSEPIATFALGRENLADVAQMPTDSPHILIFTVYSHSQSVLVESTNGCRALCMPMHVADKDFLETAHRSEAFPLLLQACKDALSWITESFDNPDDQPSVLVIDLHYAIAKAEA